MVDSEFALKTTLFAALAVVISVAYAIGTGGLLLELTRIAASALGLDWFPQSLSLTTRIGLGIIWILIVAPLYMTLQFKSVLVGALARFLFSQHLLVQIEAAIKEFTARYRSSR